MPPHAVVTPTRFGLIRHGETGWNRQKVIQGRTETRLNPTGRAQARLWAVRLAEFPWDRILASDLLRARETAGVINQELKLALHPESGIREQDWGTWTGSTVKELRAAQGDRVAAQESAGWDFRPPEGESRRDVLQRSSRALLAAAQRWPGNRILVVTHSGVLKCLIYHLTGRRFLPDEPPLIRPYHLHWLQITSDGLALDRVNALAL